MNPKSSDFVFKLNKTTNNYSVYDLDKKRIQYTIKNVFLPFGLERYNDSEILNIEVRDRSNYHHNTILIFKDIDTKLNNIDIKDIDNTNLEYYHILNQTKSKRYMLRTYLKNGAKLTHSKYFGTYDKTTLRQKYCDITLELGSIWIDRSNNRYGCTTYVSSIKVLS